MGDAESRGPQVAAEETLYQFVPVPSFWVAKENRPSSSLFDNPPCVSVNVASLTTLDECRRQLREDLGKPDGGMVSYRCGRARELGFDARHEPERGNRAHAHLYCDGLPSKKRKTHAQQLARLCAVVFPPRF